MAFRAVVLALCVVVAAVAAVDAATPRRKPRWAIVKTQGVPVRRHEACFVMVRGKGYLIGGRGRTKPVSVYDPRRRRWSNKPGPGVEIHHMQCVPTPDGKIWIPSSWYGGYPREKNHAVIHVFDTVTSKWSTRPGLPEKRRRGGGAVVLRANKLWVAGGARGGHGAQATSLKWFDAYNLRTGKWETNKPDAPFVRDHVGGAVVAGKFCVAGGRDGGKADFFNRPILPTMCFNFRTYRWERKANIPVGRAGSAYGVDCKGRMMVAGGEGKGKAYSRVDYFNGSRWVAPSSLQKSRHGSGLAVSKCSCGQVIIASGAGGQGGGNELTTTETYFPDGVDRKCSSY